MAEYIDRERLKEVFDRNVVGAGVFNDIIDAQPTADVVEREKIDKAIEEMETIIKQWEHRVEIREKNSCYHDETNNYIALSNQLIGMEKILEILKRNIGE